MSAEELPDNVHTISFVDALGERYLAYALSTITSRSLPDVRDGLKPVHRRLLYAMRELNLSPTTSPKKSARVVGDVIGKFHPHGDVAVYDAMVRLAQEFAVRYPLVDGQGNFGNIDGDNPAAMRYTEARMTEVAKALLEGLDENAIDFRPTYDGDTEEPIVLPAAFPNLLANGSSGIAVGMATNIPPHNVEEICNACLHLIKHPNASIDALLKHMPGPDFPTGGTLVESQDAIKQAYETGKGSMRVRAKWNVEGLKNGGYQIIITEIPYQVQKAKLIEKIADLINAKKLTLLADVIDESAEDVRIVLEPKSRNVNAEVLMESLFKLTDLESRFSLNLNVLDMGRVPKVMNLREVLQAFLNHRHEVLIRRTHYRMDQILDRLEILEGLLAAYLNLDEVIRIIREEDEPKDVLKRKFKLSERQAEAILNMRLRSLRKLEEMKIRDEDKELKAEQKALKELIKSADLQWQTISDEVKVMKEKFGKKTEIGKRRTEIADAPVEIDIPLDATIEKEPVTVVVSQRGWVRTMKGHGIDPSSIKYKDDDAEGYLLSAQTTDKLLIFASDGRFFTLGIDKLPGGRGHGEPLKLMCEMGADVQIVGLKVHETEASDGVKLLVASTDGRGFIVNEKDVLAQTRNGKQILNVKDDAEAAVMTIAKGDHVAVVTSALKLLVFPISELPEMTRGRGNILQKLGTKDRLTDIKTFNKADPLEFSSGKGGFNIPDVSLWLGKRASAGRKTPVGFDKTGKFNA